MTIEKLVDESAAETLEAISPGLASAVRLLVQAKQSPRQIARHVASRGLSPTTVSIVESAAHHYKAKATSHQR